MAVKLACKTYLTFFYKHTEYIIDIEIRWYKRERLKPTEVHQKYIKGAKRKEQRKEGNQRKTTPAHT